MANAVRSATGPSAGLAALASALLPGIGQHLTGARRLGVILLMVDFTAVILAAVVLVWLPTLLLEAWVTPSSLTLLLIINIMVMAYRSWASFDSFRRPARRDGVDWALGMVTVVLLAAPHLLFGGLVRTQQGLLEQVFAAPEEPVSVAVSVTTTTTTEPSSNEVAVTTTSAVAPTTTTTPAPRFWDGQERLNILLLGSDAGVGRRGTRTDTMILASIDPTSGDTAMFSIPRNLTEAPLPEGMGIWSCKCFPDILTHLWANGEWYPEAFPGPQAPSVNAMKAAVGLTFGVDVQYYAKVDLAGFVAMVDAIGGVTIDVPKRIVDETYPHENGGTEFVVFEPGEQHLDGHEALAYSRIRRHSGDFARMHRQRCLMAALVEQTSVYDIITGYGELADAAIDHVETDIPIDRLPDLVALYNKISADRLGTLRITRYNYGAAGHAGYQLYDLERLREDAAALLADPTVNLETQDSAGLEATCDESFD